MTDTPRPKKGKKLYRVPVIRRMTQTVEVYVEASNPSDAAVDGVRTARGFPLGAWRNRRAGDPSLGGSVEQVNSLPAFYEEVADE